MMRFFYTSCSHWQTNLSDGDYSENLNIGTFCEDQNLDVIYGLKISIQEIGLEEEWIENQMHLLLYIMTTVILI